MLPTACPCPVPWHAGAANARDCVFGLTYEKGHSRRDVSFSHKCGDIFFGRLCSNASIVLSGIELVLLITKFLAHSDIAKLLFFENIGGLWKNSL